MLRHLCVRPFGNPVWINVNCQREVRLLLWLIDLWKIIFQSIKFDFLFWVLHFSPGVRGESGGIARINSKNCHPFFVYYALVTVILLIIEKKWKQLWWSDHQEIKIIFYKIIIMENSFFEYSENLNCWNYSESFTHDQFSDIFPRIFRTIRRTMKKMLYFTFPQSAFAIK